MQDLTISIVQTDLFWEHAEKNLAAFDKKLNFIKKSTDLMILPEMFNTAFSMNPSTCAERPDGRTMNWLRKKAIEKNCVITGSMMSEVSGKYFNRFVWMNPSGNYEYYDKKHLFRFAGEHEVFSSGNKKITPEVKGWKFRPMVCYDLRFPVWSMNTYEREHYEFDVLLYVANWPEKRRHAWMSLLIARAIENQSYVIGVNRIGNDGKGNSHSGDSMVVDPKGTILVQIPAHSEAIETITLSFSEMQKYRDHFRVALDWDQFTIEG